MNIKLDSKNKIRLSQEDLLFLNLNQRYEKEFKMTNIVHFLIRLTIDVGLNQSLVNTTCQELAGVKMQSIWLRVCEDDLNKIARGECIHIEDLAIEVDRWSIEKRSKKESEMINK